MHFRTVINLSFTFSYVNLINTFICIIPHICIIMCTYAFYFCLCLYMCAYYLCVSPCEINEGIVYFHLCQFYPFVCLCTIWHFTFSQKSDCGKINIVLFVISVIIILVKLLQIILSYVTNFLV